MTHRADTESELVRRWIEHPSRSASLAGGPRTPANETDSFDWDELVDSVERRRSALAAELGAADEDQTSSSSLHDRRGTPPPFRRNA